MIDLKKENEAAMNENHKYKLDFKNIENQLKIKNEQYSDLEK